MIMGVGPVFNWSRQQASLKLGLTQGREMMKLSVR